MKVSDWVKKVENICSGSVPVVEWEYYTPPVSQMTVNIPSKLSTPPNLPTFWGQEPVLNTEGLIDQWLFQVEGALSTHTEEAVWSAVIGSVRRAAHELLEFLHYGEDECHTQTYKKNDLNKTLLKQNTRKNSF